MANDQTEHHEDEKPKWHRSELYRQSGRLDFSPILVRFVYQILLGPTSIDFFSFSFLSSLRLFFVIPGHDIISSNIIVITFLSFPSLEMISSHFSFFSSLSSPRHIYTCVCFQLWLLRLCSYVYGFPSIK